MIKQWLREKIMTRNGVFLSIALIALPGIGLAQTRLAPDDPAELLANLCSAGSEDAEAVGAALETARGALSQDDGATAFAALAAGAEVCDGPSLVLLGQMYRNGEGARLDLDVAETILRAALDTDARAAAVEPLSAVLVDGGAGLDDTAATVALLEEATQTGSASAMVRQAQTLDAGIFGPPDPSGALALYLQAHAINQSPGTAKAIGDLFLRPDGDDYDAEQAELWYRRASENGNRWGTFALADLLADDRFGREDAMAAATAYDLAIARGLGRFAFLRKADLVQADPSLDARSLPDLYALASAAGDPEGSIRAGVAALRDWRDRDGAVDEAVAFFRTARNQGIEAERLAGEARRADVNGAVAAMQVLMNERGESLKVSGTYGRSTLRSAGRICARANIGSCEERIVSGSLLGILLRPPEPEGD